MIRRMALPVLAALVFSAMAAAAATVETVDTTKPAQEAKKPQNVDVESDQMEVFDKENKAIFKGSVGAKRGTTTLKCDTLVVTYQKTPPAQPKQPAQPAQPIQQTVQTQPGEQAQPASGEDKTEVTFLDASGNNTTIITSSQTITGEKAHMDVKANTVTVEGNVKVVQGKTIITGQKLFSDLNSNKSQMTGGRVKSSFVPGQSGQ